MGLAVGQTEKTLVVSEAVSATAVPDDIIAESFFSPMQLVVLAVCFVANVIEGFDVVVVAHAAPAITADWGVSSTQLGITLSAGVLGMTLGAMFLSSLSDLFGRRVVLSGMMLLAGVATWCVTYTDNVTELMVLRLVAGLGLGGMLATIVPLVGEYSPRRYRTLSLAITFAGASLGPIIGGLISAQLITVYGWKAIFEVAGVLTVVMGVVIYLVVPESIAYIIKRKPEGALERVNRILVYIGQQPVASLPPTALAEAQESASVVSLLKGHRRLKTLAIWGAFFLSFAAVYFLHSWIPQVLSNAGFSQQRAIQGAVVASSGSIVGTLVFGWLGRWWDLNRVIAVAFAVGAVGLVMLSVLFQYVDGSAYLLVWAILFLVGVTVMGGFANLYTIATLIYPAQIRSTGVGWAAGLGRFGAVISPALAGFLIAAGVTMPVLFLSFAVPTLMAVVCVVLVPLREMS
ncbi:MAG: MFS transporter [Bacteroidales bacterium]|nr:MFS transporter [Bacteroidales bacterium]